MRVSVVIPTYNGAATLTDALRAVLRQSHPVEQVIVVDSSSTDGTADIVRQAGRIAGREIELVSIPKSAFHHARTRDLALSRCGAELAVLLVQDAVPADERWLSELVRPLEDDSVAASYSRILPTDSAHLLAQRDALRDPCAKESSRTFTAADMSACRYHHVSACVRLSAWKSLPFASVAEEDLGFGEDIRWARSIASKGWSIAFAPGSVVRHCHSYSLTGVRARERLDARCRQSLGERGRKLGSVPLYVGRNVAEDALFSLFAPVPLAMKAQALALSIPYRTAQALGQWQGTRDPLELP